MFNNSDNDAWNTIHNGNRVPINDTGNPGSPICLNVTEGWDEGSITRAIHRTYTLENSLSGDPKEEDLQNGSMNFVDLFKYTNRKMLYGFNGDIRNKRPGSLTGFRGYPTPMVSDSLVLVTPNSKKFINVSGTEGVNGDFIVYSHSLVLSYKVPFDIIYNTAIKINGTLVPSIYDFKIEAGNFRVTHYRQTVGEETPENPWIDLPGEAAIFSFNTFGVTGNVTIDIESVNIVQEPVYYGSTADISIPESSYRPVTPVTGQTIVTPRPFVGLPLEGSFDINSVEAYESWTNRCNDYAQFQMFPRTVYPNVFYKKTTDPLAVGTKLYRDSQTTLPALNSPSDAGAFFWIENTPWWHFGLNQSIFSISRFLMLDENSIITYYDQGKVGYLGKVCWNKI